MKILRKINKGVILTLIVLIVLMVYLVGLEKKREAEKGNIIVAIEDFIKLTDEYSVYPENTNTVTQKISSEDRKKYLEEMKSELKKVMIPNEEVVKLQAQALENILNLVNQQQEVIVKTERNILKISSYEFDDNQVTVGFESIVENTMQYLDGQGKEQTRKDSYQTYSDEIILQKIDEKWKIVYSNLQYEHYKYYSEDVMIMY